MRSHGNAVIARQGPLHKLAVTSLILRERGLITKPTLFRKHNFHQEFGFELSAMCS